MRTFKNVTWIKSYKINRNVLSLIFIKPNEDSVRACGMYFNRETIVSKKGDVVLFLADNFFFSLYEINATDSQSVISRCNKYLAYVSVGS